MQHLLPKQPRILVVEDDHHARTFMESSLELSGFSVTVAESAEKAMDVFDRKNNQEPFHAVLSDFRLPGKSGIELLGWIREKDKTLATVIVTGQGEKSIVEQSLSLGVFDYVEKPVTHQYLRKVIWSAVHRTTELRKSKSDREGLLALENLDLAMNISVPEEFKDNITVIYQPLHEVGGDFLITHEDVNDRFIILVGDISGHDIRSGFVSTYFQGLFKGSLESSNPVEKSFEISNRSLKKRSRDANTDETISLSLSAIEISHNKDYLQHWNYGMTPCHTVNDSGRIEVHEFGRWPLGWMPEIDTSPVRIYLNNKCLLYIFTDGMDEFADLLQVDKFSLFFRFLHELNSLSDLPVRPQDDILAIKYNLKDTMPSDVTFEPIISEHYAGTEVEHIDQLQSSWRRSITFALQDRLGDRLYDLLICIREGMINALTHGCESSAEKFAHLQISLNEAQDIIRVYIDDPGKGHDFDLMDRLNRIGRETGKNLGLGIVQHLSDKFRIENQGTSLVFDFQINPEGE